MSYASVVAKGGPQDPEEAKAPELDTIIPTEESVSSLVDVDSGVSVVPSDFNEQEVKTQTQADRLELEAVAAEEEAAREKAAAAAALKKQRAADRAREAGSDVLSFFKDPVHAGGLVLSTAVAVAVGLQGWRKYKAGEFSWKVAGIGAGILVGFSVVEFYASRFAQNFIAKKKRN